MRTPVTAAKARSMFDCVVRDEEAAINSNHRIANVCARNGQLRLQE
jgi:hypothetical protein